MKALLLSWGSNFDFRAREKRNCPGLSGTSSSSIRRRQPFSCPLMNSTTSNPPGIVRLSPMNSLLSPQPLMNSTTSSWQPFSCPVGSTFDFRARENRKLPQSQRRICIPSGLQQFSTLLVIWIVTVSKFTKITDWKNSSHLKKFFEPSPGGFNDNGGD